MITIRQHIRGVFAAYICACFAFLVPMTPAYAESLTPPLEISQQFSYNGADIVSQEPSAEYTLVALDKPSITGGASSFAPLPEGAHNHEYHFTLTGVNASTKLNIPFTHTGAYYYKLYCTSSNSQYTTYDTRVFDITAYVTGATSNTYNWTFVSYVEGTTPDIQGKSDYPVFHHTIINPGAPSDTPSDNPGTPSDMPDTPSNVNTPAAFIDHLAKTVDALDIAVFIGIITATISYMIILIIRKKREAQQ